MVNRFQALSQNEGVKKFAKAFAHLSGDRLIRLVVGVFIQMWSARYLGPANLGKVNYVIEFCNVFSMIVVFGLDEHVTKVILSKKENVSSVLSSALSFRVVLSFLFYLLSVIIAWNIQTDRSIFWMICIFGLTTLTKPFEVLELYYQTELHTRPLVVARQVGFALNSSAKVFSIMATLSWPFFVIASLIEFVFNRAFIVFSYLRRSLSLKIQTRKEEIVSNIFFGFPFLIISLFFFLEFRVGLFMVDHFFGLHEVGIYSLVMNLLVLGDFFSNVIITSSLPSIFPVKDVSSAQYKRRFQYLLTGVSLYNAFLLICSLAFGNVFISLLFGEKFLEAAALLPWGCVYLLLNGFNQIKYRYFVFEEGVRAWLFFQAFAFTFALVLQSLYLKSLGPVFVFQSFILSYVLTTVLTTFLPGYRKVISFFIKP